MKKIKVILQENNPYNTPSKGLKMFIMHAKHTKTMKFQKHFINYMRCNKFKATGIRSRINGPNNIPIHSLFLNKHNTQIWTRNLEVIESAISYLHKHYNEPNRKLSSPQ